MKNFDVISKKKFKVRRSTLLLSLQLKLQQTILKSKERETGETLS